jgi:cathepsin L
MLSLLLSLSSSKPLLFHEERQFVQWMRTHNKLYVGEEYQLRLGIFASTVRWTREFNSAPGHKFTVGLNHLAALTPAEYQAMLGYRRPSGKVTRDVRRHVRGKVDPPASLDYRDQGAVNEIKDQGQCGSCWAFSAIQTAESTFYLKYKQLLSLSEQDLVDCDIFDNGCEGGNMLQALAYVIVAQSGYFEQEADYPYEGVDGECRYNSSLAAGIIIDLIETEPFSEADLVDGVATFGPAAVAVDASLASFQLYTSGIYNDPDCSTIFLDHGVGVIGYGTDSGTDYFIIRNSWGTDWGEKGYMRLIRNGWDTCGVATQAVIALQNKEKA